MISANTVLHQNEGMEKASIVEILKRHNTEGSSSKKLYFKVKKVSARSKESLTSQR